MFIEFISLLFCTVIVRIFIISIKKEKNSNIEEYNQFMVHFILSCVIYLILKYLF